MIQQIATEVVSGIITAAILAVFGFYLRLYMRRRNRGVKKKELIGDIKNKTNNPRYLVVLYALTVLQMAWTIVLFTVVPLVQFYTGGDDYKVATPLNLFLTLFVMGTVAIPVSIYMNHRIQKSEWWLNVGIVVTTWALAVFEISALLDDFPRPKDADVMLVLLGVTFVFLLPGLYIGRYLAIKTQSQFVIAQLFSRLPTKDRREIIELVDSLPSVSK